MATFRSLRNPNYWVKPSRLGRRLQFVESIYSTDDPAEIAVLRRSDAVEEVSVEAAQAAYVSGETGIAVLERDVETALQGEGELDARRELADLSRRELDKRATDAGVPGPERLRNREAVIDAILASADEPEPIPTPEFAGPFHAGGVVPSDDETELERNAREDYEADFGPNDPDGS